MWSLRIFPHQPDPQSSAPPSKSGRRFARLVIGQAIKARWILHRICVGEGDRAILGSL
jgi:hypothetical protein